jgi:general secretion pathway protein I
MRPRPSRGFSLLEVMMAVAILGGALTAILSAQASIAASNKLGNNLGMAMSLGRCRMTEVEDKLLKFGYPDIEDTQTELPCCDDKDVIGFTCESRVERVLMPNPPSLMGASVDGGLSLSGASPSAMFSSGLAGASPSALSGALGGLGGSSGISGLGGLSGVTQSISGDGGFGTLNLEAGIQSIGSSLTTQMGGGGAGTQGLLSMVMGFVYPFLKPMMEASIRKLTVVVRWKEGSIVKEFTLLQYVTNPSNGGLGGAASASASGTAGGAGGAGAGGASKGTTLSTTPVGH